MTECKFKKNEILVPDTESAGSIIYGIERVEVQVRYKLKISVRISVTPFLSKYRNNFIVYNLSNKFIF